MRELPFNQVEKLIRKKKFGFLGSVTDNGMTHVAGVVYAISPPGEEFCLYIITGTGTRKAKNIQSNPHVSFAIPFPHYFLRMAPDFCIQFQGQAKILPFIDPKGQEAMKRNRILKRMLKKPVPDDTTNQIIIRVTPNKKISGFGLGMNIFKLLKKIESGRFFSRLPGN